MSPHSRSPRVTGVGPRTIAPTPLFVFDTEVNADITIPPKDMDPIDPELLIETDPLVELPTGDQQLAILCARGRSNAITTAFCTNPRPALTGLLDVQSLLGLAFASDAMSFHSATMQYVRSPVLIMLARARPGQFRSALLWASKNSCSRPGFTRKRTALNALMAHLHKITRQ
jgi:hypothetical protein